MKYSAVTLAALLMSSVCLAQQGPGGGAPGGAGGGMPANEVIMERNDANKDGEITQAEAQAAETQLGANFALFDLDSDGKVVAAELDTMRSQIAGGAGPGTGGPARGQPGGQPGTQPGAQPADQ